MALPRFSLAWLSWTASGQSSNFCPDGLSLAQITSKSELDEDGDVPSIDVLLGQALKFPSAETGGEKLDLSNLYDTTIILHQNTTNEDATQGYDNWWTLEFMSTDPDVVHAIIPEVSDNTIHWKQSDARYCLTRQVKYGADHWKKRFDNVARVTTSQLRRLMTDFVFNINDNPSGIRPQYQLWNVVSSTGRTLIEDVTGADGAAWFLNQMFTTLGNPTLSGFVFRSSKAQLLTDDVERVDVSDPEVWADVVAYFKNMTVLLPEARNTADWWEALATLPDLGKYIYDPNAKPKTYYRLKREITDQSMKFVYTKQELEVPAWYTPPNKGAGEMVWIIVTSACLLLVGAIAVLAVVILRYGKPLGQQQAQTSELPQVNSSPLIPSDTRGPHSAAGNAADEEPRQLIRISSDTSFDAGRGPAS